MVLNNNVSTRKFVMKPNPAGTFKDIEPNFGIIKGLHLEYLEFASKIKKNAPVIPEPSYSGKLFDEPKYVPVPPTVGIAIQADEKTSPSGTHRKGVYDDRRETPHRDENNDRSKRSYDDSYSSSSSSTNTQENKFFDQFGATPDKKGASTKGMSSKGPTSKKGTSAHLKETPLSNNGDDSQGSRKSRDSEKSSRHSRDEESHNNNHRQQQKSSKYIPVLPPVEAEPPPLTEDEQYLEDELERRENIRNLRKLKVAKNIDVGDVPDDLDLQTSRILVKAANKQVNVEQSVSLNRFALVGTFFGIDQGCGMFTDKMKGYFTYQMEIMKVYDDYLEAIGETNLSQIFQQLDPSLQLGGIVGLTTAGFFLFQNFIGEDKVKGAKLIQSLFPGNSKVIEEMTQASKKIKEEKRGEGKKAKSSGDKTSGKKAKKRGPTFTAADIGNMEN